MDTALRGRCVHQSGTCPRRVSQAKERAFQDREQHLQMNDKESTNRLSSSRSGTYKGLGETRGLNNPVREARVTAARQKTGWFQVMHNLAGQEPASYVHTAVFKTDNQQGPTVQHGELCSMLCGSLDGRGVWGRMDTCIHMAESLCCAPETTTTLRIGYNPIENTKFF